MARRHALLLAMLLAGSANGAELGEPQIASHLGQPLAVLIELLEIEQPGQQVQVRLADANVYRAANIGMPHLLSTLNLSVTRQDGRQFLRVSSRAPLEASPLHLYLELQDGEQRNVRLVSLWLKRAPANLVPHAPPPSAPPTVTAVSTSASATPAAPPPVVPRAARAPATPANSGIAETPAAQPIVPPKAAPGRAGPRQAEPLKPAARQAAPRQANTSLAAQPEKPEPKAPNKAPPPSSTAPEAAPVVPATAAALAVAASAAQPPAPACAPAPDPQQESSCAALDEKNAQLRARISELEAKVRELQRQAPLVSRALQRQGDTRWGWIATVVLGVLAAGGGLWWQLYHPTRVAARKKAKGPVLDSTAESDNA